MTHDITTHDDQRLFVIPSGDGYSCLGYDICYSQAVRLWEILGKKGVTAPRPDENEIGQVVQYHQLQAMWSLVSQHRITLPTWFGANTPKKVQAILEDYRTTGAPLRVFYGDRETGRDWLEENDVLGRIGRSMGPMKVPLLIEEGENGGPVLLDDCIVRLVDAEYGTELYRHPTYSLGEIQFEALSPGGIDGKVAVKINGATHAGFSTMEKAIQWASFMLGFSMTAPA